jgi:hypothetical protein
MLKTEIEGRDQELNSLLQELVRLTGDTWRKEQPNCIHYADHAFTKFRVNRGNLDGMGAAGFLLGEMRAAFRRIERTRNIQDELIPLRRILWGAMNETWFNMSPEAVVRKFIEYKIAQNNYYCNKTGDDPRA